MKIGILTQPLANNYGGLLQNFALQYVLKELGHTPVTINIPYALLEENRNWMRCAWRCVKRLRGDKSILFLDSNRQLNFFNTPCERQKSFIQKHINVSELSGCGFEEFLNTNGFDAIIVGSDQVWRKAFSPDFPVFFMRDVPDSIKKITYAVSFGTDKSDIPQEEVPFYRMLVQRIDYISVREKSGVIICKSLFDREAEMVLDPTLLLNKEDYLSLMDQDNTTAPDVLAVYLLDRNQKSNAIVDSVYKTMGLKPVYIGIPTKKGFPSVESWLSTISKARFVITDSFHGTAFSVIFQKQFLTLSNCGRGNSRMETLLDIINLKGRMIDANNSGFSIENLTTIDYDSVNKSLAKMKDSSISFLLEALS